MDQQIDWTSAGVFIFFFLLVTVMGFAAAVKAYAKALAP